MQILPTSIVPVTPPTRHLASPAASNADPAGFASLLRQTVEPPAPMRAATGTPMPVPPPVRPSAPATPTRAGTPPAAGSASKKAASAHDGTPPDAADGRSTDAPNAPPGAADNPAAPAAGGTPAGSSGPLRARTAAADAGSEPKAATPGDAASGPVDADAAEEVADKLRKPGARGASDAATGTATLPTPTPLPTPPTPAQALAATPAPDTGRTPGASGARGAAGGDGSAAQPSLGMSAAADTDTDTDTDTATAYESRVAPAGAARDGGTSAVSARADDPATTGASPAAPPSPGSAFAGLLAEHRQGADTGAAPHASSAVDGSLAAGGTTAFAAAPVFGTAAPQTAEVSAPVGSPDFSRQLGVQVSVLAKDGVQHAELHLNPADMGPVSVQITMDGTQARVEFGAEVAATRQAIESGLPQLASALADAGFTLAGGGVSQHGGGSGGREPQGGGGRASDSRATEPVTAAAPTRRVATVGGLDLYA